MADNHTLSVEFDSDISGLVKGIEQAKSALKDIENTFSNALGDIGEGFQDLGDKAKSLGDSVSESISESVVSLSKAEEKIGKIGDNMTSAGKTMSKKVTLPIVGAGAAAVKLGVDFEKAMSEVAAVSGATEEELQQLEITAREAGATTDKSARDAADALQYMALAGWDVEDSQKALMPVLKLSSAAGMELGRTSDLVTDTMSVLGLEIDDLESYLDVLAQTSRNSNTDVDQLGESFLVVGGKLTQLGIDVEEGAVALGLLADNGIKGSEAGRGLNAILTNLTAPTGRAKEALEELGISAFDSNGEFIGIEETLKQVQDATSGMTQEQQNLYLSMIAGKEHGKTLNALMSELGGGFESLTNDVAGADGALEEMYGTATDNTMGALNDLKSAVEELGLKIFENLKPAIDKIVNGIQKFIDILNSLSPKQQEMVIQIGLIVAAIGPALMILGSLAGAVSNILGVAGKLMGGFSKITGLIKGVGKAFTFLTSPTGLIILAIVALVAVGVLLYKNWDKIKETATKVWESLKDLWETVSGFFKAIWEPIADWFSGVWESVIGKVKEIWDKFVSFLGDLIAGILTIWLTPYILMYEVVQEVVNYMKELWEQYGETFREIWTSMTEWLTEKWESLKEIFTALWEFLSEIVTNYINNFIEIWTGVIEWLVEKWESLKEIFTALWEFLSEIVTNWIDNFIEFWTMVIEWLTEKWESFKEIFTELWESLKETVTAWAEAFRGLIEPLIEWFKEKWESVKETFNALKEFITGIWESIKETIVGIVQPLVDKVKELFTGMKDAVGEKFDAIKTAVSDTMQGAIDIVTGWFSSFKEAGGNIIGNIADGIAGAWNKVKDTVSGTFQKIRDMIPFSPPKDKSSPLVGLEKNGIVGNIVRGMESSQGILDNAMGNLLGGYDDELNFAFSTEVIEGDLRNFDNEIGHMVNGQVRASVETGAKDKGVVNKQPAVIYIGLGRQELEYFVDDINEVNNRRERRRNL